MSVDYKSLNDHLLQNGIDLDSIKDGLGHPIDEKIKPLLIVLLNCGYATAASCEGHSLAYIKWQLSHDDYKILSEDEFSIAVERNFEERRYTQLLTQAPWVDLVIDNTDLQELTHNLERYNFQNIPTWDLTPILPNRQRLSADYKYSLNELHGSIFSLSEFLYDNIIKK